MDRTEVATALCEIPKYLQEHPDTSLSARLQEILASRTDPVREADLISTLSEHRDLVDSWAAYVEDQRTLDGWYVEVSNGPTRRPDWILARPDRKDRLAFDSPIAAYAALILRVVAQGLGVGQSPSPRL
jgi:hypothetical protein